MHTDRCCIESRQKCRAQRWKINLNTKIQRMWNMKCKIVPVITGAIGIVTRGLEKSLEAIPGKYSIDSLHQTAVLGTSHLIRKVMQCEI